MKELRLHSLKDTMRVASLVAKLPLKGRMLGLSGPLGSGKTAFTRALLSALGSKDKVSSPTFVLCHEYEAGDLLIEHWDLYRLAKGPAELFEEVEALRIIEWPEKAEELTGNLDLILRFKFPQDRSDVESRILSIEGNIGQELETEISKWR